MTPPPASKAKNSKIDWLWVWAEFDAWEERQRQRCKKCHQITDESMWDDCQEKITELVEEELDKQVIDKKKGRGK